MDQEAQSCKSIMGKGQRGPRSIRDAVEEAK